jgi:hypothetical protein
MCCFAFFTSFVSTKIESKKKKNPKNSEATGAFFYICFHTILIISFSFLIIILKAPVDAGGKVNEKYDFIKLSDKTGMPLGKLYTPGKC